MDEAQRGEPMAMEIVEAMRSKAFDFLKHCDVEIGEAEARLKYWMGQKDEMQNFLVRDQFEVVQEVQDQEDRMRDVEIAPKQYATTDLRASYASR